MNSINNDVEYNNIVKDILNNEEFNKIKLIEHHGITRYEHSLKVSYYSYKFARFMRLDYVTTARGGLLHDFFLSNEHRSTIERFTSTFVHPKYAAKNSANIFGINKKEYDIIRTHMFPINLSVPKYAESWIVSTIDKVIGTFEFGKKYKNRLNYLLNLFIIVFINSFK